MRCYTASVRRHSSHADQSFDLVAKEFAQRNPKLRDVDTKFIVDLQFARELERSGFLQSLKGN